MSAKQYEIHLKNTKPESLAEFRRQIHVIKDGETVDNLEVKIREKITFLNSDPSYKDLNTATFTIDGNQVDFEKNDGEWTEKHMLDAVVLGTQKRGFVLAEEGIRLHETPSTDDAAYNKKKGIYAHVYPPAEEVKIISDKNGWMNIAIGSNDGYIESRFIQEIPVNDALDSYTDKFYYVKKGDILEKVLIAHYGSKEERRILAQAVAIMNQGSKHIHGITFTEKEGSVSENLMVIFKNAHDPWLAGARNIYEQIELTANHIIRLPNKGYLEYLAEMGKITLRPWVFNAFYGDKKAIEELEAGMQKIGKAVIDLAAGTAGMVYGILEGFLTALWDALASLVDLAQQIFKVLQSLLTGEFLTDLKKMYDALIGLKIDQLKELVVGLLGPLGEAIKKAVTKWDSLSVFEKAALIGKIIGAIIFEIVLAVFTGGAANAAKWTAKLGKLGKGLGKIAKFGDKVKKAAGKGIPPKYRKYLDKNGRSDYDSDVDGKSYQRQMLLNLGRVTAQAKDKDGSNITELTKYLYAESKLLFPKLPVQWLIENERKDVYDVYFKASPKKKVIDNFTNGNLTPELSKEDRAKRINAITKNEDGKFPPKKKKLQVLNNKDTPESGTAVDAYLDQSKIRDRVIKDAGALEHVLNKSVVKKYIEKYKGLKVADKDGKLVDVEKLTETDLTKLFAAQKGDLTLLTSEGKKLKLTFEAHHIIPKDLLLDKDLGALRDFLNRNKNSFDFNGPDNGIPIHKLIGEAGEAGGHSSHKAYNKLIKDKILEIRKDLSKKELDDEIFDIIKEARKTIEDKVVGVGETGEKINNIIF